MADGDLRAAHFPYWFDFVRLSAQPYRDATGSVVTAAANIPRFDHDDAGKPCGLLVGAGEAMGTGDRARLQADILTDVSGDQVTVLHAITRADGGIDRRAWYGRDARAIVNILMSMEAAHAIVAVLPGFRPNKGGFVRCRGESWFLANAIGAGDGAALADSAGRLLIEQ